MAHSEKTPARLLAYFRDMIELVTRMDGYDPSSARIASGPIETLHASAVAVLDEFHTVKATFGDGRKERLRVVQSIKDISRRALRFLEATDARQSRIDQATTIYRDIQGYKTPGTGDPEKEPTASSEEGSGKRSDKQGSQSSLVGNFSKFIKVLKLEPLYDPREADLKISALEALVADYNRIQKEVSGMEASWNKVQAKAEKTFNEEKKGVSDVMTDVKAYVLAAYKPNSAEYKNIKKIPVFRIKFKK